MCMSWTNTPLDNFLDVNMLITEYINLSFRIYCEIYELQPYNVKIHSGPEEMLCFTLSLMKVAIDSVIIFMSFPSRRVLVCPI